MMVVVPKPAPAVGVDSDHLILPTIGVPEAIRAEVLDQLPDTARQQGLMLSAVSPVSATDSASGGFANEPRWHKAYLRLAQGL